MKRLALLLMAAAAACGGQSGLQVEDHGRTVQVAPASSAAVPSSSAASLPRRVTASVAVGGDPVVAWDGGSTLWAVSWGGGPRTVGTLIGIDIATDRASAPLPLPPSTQPYLLAVHGGRMWIATGSQLLLLDRSTGQTLAHADLPGAPQAVLQSGHAVWVTVRRPDEPGLLLRFRPSDVKQVASIQVGSAPHAVTAVPGAVWVTDDTDGTLTRVNPRTNRVTGTTTIRTAGGGPASEVTVYEDSIWVLEGASVVRISRRTGVVLDHVDLGAAAVTLAAGAGGIWVSGPRGLQRLDPVTGALDRPLQLGSCGHLATTGDAVWVVHRPAGSVLRVSG